MVDPDSVERATIADLEVYGLPIREINILEESGGLLYVDQLRSVTEVQLMRYRNFGVHGLELVRAALRRWVAGRPVKTVEECVVFRRGVK